MRFTFLLKSFLLTLLYTVFFDAGAQNPSTITGAQITLEKYEDGVISLAELQKDTSLNILCGNGGDFQSAQLVIVPSKGGVASVRRINHWRISKSAVLAVLDCPVDSKIIIDNASVRLKSGEIQRVAPLLFQIIP